MKPLNEAQCFDAMCDEIERLRARVAELEAAQKWRPIGALTQEHGPVLGMIEMMGQRRCEEVYRCPLGVVRATKDRFPWNYVTHWLPLPPPPAPPQPEAKSDEAR